MDLVELLQDLVGRVPEIVQPLIVAVAGAIPFVEGEGGVAIGIIAGIHPVVAAVAAMAGNFLVVAGLVLLGSGARAAVVSRANGRTGASGRTDVPDDRTAVRRAKFQRAYERYGVPGVSLLGPLLLPTHFTATMLAASGVGKARILVWQAVAIVAWTTLTALIVTGVIGVVR
ncbi:small multidrug efflux protein [Promicromonospora thailandica]|uniref:Small multidrug efflux protein n=1 Tax=Promicromonospora thailandica TaxID=765201 RepID=A0A9X2G4Q9_9MICO|nr:small multidrug efflux protein [Promicromonospora thailandica]MCP2267067.1 hypothetical protein [Promicromonospora thailandica]BFF16655.1 hypothetical protein GCM10025730_01760 [Promicromonospora thailandica]